MKEVTPLMNSAIVHKKVRCIHENGHNYGVIYTSDALIIAEEERMDLVLVSTEMEIPIAKIINYGKFLYEKKKSKHRQNKTKAMKEIKLRHVTDENDFLVKAKHAKEFLEDGHRVKVSMQFKGRELKFVDLGLKVLKAFEQNISSAGKVEKAASQEGRSLYLILCP
ncbi:translation initiation factor IF-3 [Pseudomonas syringae pv. actinidiae]|nr:translation initiation factor IF-3 [Pseudomonas syringae pv. actinidiae]